ncbi:MAG: VWA domain-containing protein [Candidatus Aenigmatarchaeota archaeon]
MKKVLFFFLVFLVEFGFSQVYTQYRIIASLDSQLVELNESGQIVRIIDSSKFVVFRSPVKDINSNSIWVRAIYKNGDTYLKKYSLSDFKKTLEIKLPSSGISWLGPTFAQSSFGDTIFVGISTALYSGNIYKIWGSDSVLNGYIVSGSAGSNHKVIVSGWDGRADVISFQKFDNTLVTAGGDVHSFYKFTTEGRKVWSIEGLFNHVNTHIASPYENASFTGRNWNELKKLSSAGYTIFAIPVAFGGGASPETSFQPTLDGGLVACVKLDWSVNNVYIKKYTSNGVEVFSISGLNDADSDYLAYYDTTNGNTLWVVKKFGNDFYLVKIWGSDSQLQNYSISNLSGSNHVSVKLPGIPTGLCLILRSSPPSISNYRIIFNQINSSSFPVIDCYVNVVDSSGQPVSNLTSSNFQVFEDGYSEQFSLTPIAGASVPISVALVIDRSGSMDGQPINDAKNAALIFVDSLRAGDRAAVISFNNQVTVDQPFTSDKNLLRSAINSIYAGGLTAIYNAAYTALSLISSEPSQRKAIILLTDGADNSSSISVDSVINYANFLNVPIYTIGLGLTPGSSEEQVLIRIAQSTGGNYYYSPTSSQLGQIYRSISSQIQNQYKLTYTTHNPNFDGSLRTVKIIVLYQSSVDSATKTYRAPLAGSWFIQLSATSGNLGDVYNFAGVHHSASDSFDIYDAPEPPSPNSNYIQLYFPHPNWNHILGPYFSRDVRLSRVLKVQTITWNFEVKTDLVNSTITLRVIPDSLVPSDYLIVLEDVDAGVKTIINENNTYTYNSGQGGVRHFKLVVGKLFISTSFNTGWNLAGFPILPDSSKFSSVLNDDIGSYYYIYSYLPDVGYYLDTSIQVGKGFWLGILNDAIIDVYGQSMPDSFEVSLNKQWNIISVPFTSDLEKSSLLFNRGGVVVNFDSATSLGWISPVLYGYARTNYFISDTLKPWKGYWLGAIVDSLKLIYIKGTTTPTPRIAFDKIVSLNNWNVYIRVNANNISDNAFFGVKADGSDQFDAKYDYPKPPFPPNTMSFIHVYFAHPEWNLVLGNNFMSDVKSPSSMMWEFTVEHNISNPTELVLQWDIGEVPNDVNLILTDLKTGSSVDMRGRSEIKFTENPGVKRLFKVSGTIVNVEKDNLIPKEFALYQNYPNPFNPETIIEFDIPKRTFVKLTIYDILGREIKTLVNEEINPGKYTVKFNASNLPSGIYFYRLDAGEFSDIKKMVFVK